MNTSLFLRKFNLFLTGAAFGLAVFFFLDNSTLGIFLANLATLLPGFPLLTASFVLAKFHVITVVSIF